MATDSVTLNYMGIPVCQALPANGFHPILASAWWRNSCPDITLTTALVTNVSASVFQHLMSKLAFHSYRTVCSNSCPFSLAASRPYSA